MMTDGKPVVSEGLLQRNIAAGGVFDVHDATTVQEAPEVINQCHMVC